MVTAFRSACLLFESLWVLLAATPRADAVLVQNPPTIPTLLGRVAGGAACEDRSFIIDWHNFGYTMLAPRLEPEHFVVRLAKTWERWLGRKADAHFCVSMAMRRILVDDFGLPAPIVLYDRPRELAASLSRFAERSAAARKILARAGLDASAERRVGSLPHQLERGRRHGSSAGRPRALGFPGKYAAAFN